VGTLLGARVVGTKLGLADGASDGGNLRIGAHQKGERIRKGGASDIFLILSKIKVDLRYAQILSDSLKNKGGIFAMLDFVRFQPLSKLAKV